MKLLRFGEIGAEKPGVLDDENNVRDLSDHIDDIDGRTISEEGLNYIRSIDIAGLPIISAQTRIGPCVGNVGKYVCIGLNYSDHAEEANMPIPSEPIIFFKSDFLHYWAK